MISNKTRASMGLFLSAINLPFWQQKDGEEPDEESSEAEIFLMKELCTTPGTLDEEKILNLLKTEDNDLRVMEALYCLLGYDIDMRDVEEGCLSEKDVDEVRRIVRLLPRWHEAAKKKRMRDSKKAKSA